MLDIADVKADVDAHLCILDIYIGNYIMIMLWKEATAAMTALVYSGLHTRLYRGYVHVY